ncbi:DNA cytosine methyltransferase [Crossiella cryophila]|uniref:DNA (cytosine-5-)-methyltransferase n=1 Tax=Crossiella cryophila TaxID=43355 RepID=A0A7W7C7D7_9PSEU|nr:DNA cytosine methyltransferase [Crossiella cryophila]MBB4675910.1 DNA (cytosine-5)-methyltransferase 1 [Crossiella cryophila]
MSTERLTSLEICAGAGGLALGLEQAGFEPQLLLENRPVACTTLTANRPNWPVLQHDLIDFDPVHHKQVYDVDLLSAGLPRVQAAATVHRTRGSDIELELLKAAVMLVHGVRPRALLIENVPALVTKDEYAPIRDFVEQELHHLEYRFEWFVINAMDHGVPQDRKQGVLVALAGDAMAAFKQPAPLLGETITVGDALRESMASRGWPQADEWAAQANRVAPTLVGGSWERGGADLGPTGSKRIWAKMGVNGGTVANEVPGPEFRWDPAETDPRKMVRLTVRQAALLQGFPADWTFAGRKTASYRQVGNASPPAVGKALGTAIRDALNAG